MAVLVTFNCHLGRAHNNMRGRPSLRNYPGQIGHEYVYDGFFLLLIDRLPFCPGNPGLSKISKHEAESEPESRAFPWFLPLSFA